MRGCITIENGQLGYVSVLPIGMAQISFVQLHFKTGDRIKRNDEIAHFELGGSDIVIVFQASAVVCAILGHQTSNFLWTTVFQSKVGNLSKINATN